MGESSRRKDLVADVRKKIGDQAAEAVQTLEQRLKQLQVQHQAFVFEIEGLRREVALAKAAPAELRRDVLSFRRDLEMKGEQIEALGLREKGLAKDLLEVMDAHGKLAARVKELERVEHPWHKRLRLFIQDYGRG